jgi:hypothetical protein
VAGVPRGKQSRSSAEIARGPWFSPIARLSRPSARGWVSTTRVGSPVDAAAAAPARPLVRGRFSLRIVAGGALIVAGLAIGGTGGTILAIVGVVPMAAGAFNVCLFAPLFGLDFTGHKRAAR